MPSRNPEFPTGVVSVPRAMPTATPLKIVKMPNHLYVCMCVCMCVCMWVCLYTITTSVAHIDSVASARTYVGNVTGARA
jgi:hypothetical protein